MNFIDSKVTEKDGKLYVQFNGFTLRLPEDKAAVVREKGYVGKEVVFGVRPENLHDDERFLNENPDVIIDAKVEVTERMGSETYLYLSIAGADAIARVNAQSKAKPEQKIKLGIEMDRTKMFDKETELAIY